MIVNLDKEELILNALGISVLVKKEETILTIEVRQEGLKQPIKTMIIPASIKGAIKEDIMKVLRTPLEDLDLSVRSYNCIKAARIETLIELVNHTEEDLMRFRNFGQKSIGEIENELGKRGLTLGMNTDEIFKYNLTF